MIIELKLASASIEREAGQAGSRLKIEIKRLKSGTEQSQGRIAKLWGVKWKLLNIRTALAGILVLGGFYQKIMGNFDKLAQPQPKISKQLPSP